MDNKAKVIESLKHISAHWIWYFILGIFLLVVGFLALNVSVFTTLLSVMFLGGILIFTGILEAIYAFRFKNWKTFILHILMSALYSFAGVFMLYNPVANALSLTLVLSIFFIALGAVRIYFAATSNIANRGWLFLNGILTFVLGILIWYQWPVSGLWVLGAFISLDLMFAGLSWIMLSLQAKNLLLDIAKQELAEERKEVKILSLDATNIIAANNYTIITCKEYIDHCKKCDNIENCAVLCQKVIDACHENIYETNIILETNKYENDYQKELLLKLKKVLNECEKKCNEALQKAHDNDPQACAWAIEACNETITTADECIEAFGG